jgi:SAM-dependent methyltransferase
VLELGCGDGANTLSLAQALPQASFIAIDLAASALARGERLARDAALENVELRCADLEHLPDDLGSFDYILAHGVYSWIPPRARGALLDCCRQRLNPHGIAYVSYNAYPGSYLRDMTRDMLLYHLRDVADPQQRLEGAHALMRTVIEIETPSPYAQALREQIERMLRYSDALLFHDDLAEISTPFYFHEFIDHATRHELRFLAEADLADSQMRDVPQSAARLMATLGDDALAREQYMDFFRNRMFRQTLLCHSEAPVRRELDDHALERFAISSSARPHESEGAAPDERIYATPEGFSLTTSEPPILAAMRALAEAWPAALDFATLLRAARAAASPAASAEPVAERLRVVLLHSYLARIVQLHGAPAPLLARPSALPLAGALARAQCAAGAPAVSSLLHASVRLEGSLEPRLLGLLDGTHDRASLLDELAASTSPPEDSPTAAQLEQALERFAAVGLLRVPSS